MHGYAWWIHPAGSLAEAVHSAETVAPHLGIVERMQGGHRSSIKDDGDSTDVPDCDDVPGGDGGGDGALSRSPDSTVPPRSISLIHPIEGL